MPFPMAILHTGVTGQVTVKSIPYILTPSRDHSQHARSCFRTVKRNKCQVMASQESTVMNRPGSPAITRPMIDVEPQNYTDAVTRPSCGHGLAFF